MSQTKKIRQRMFLLWGWEKGLLLVLAEESDWEGKRKFHFNNWFNVSSLKCKEIK